MTNKQTKTMSQIYDQGMKLRREVLGAEYVDTSLANANDFMMAFQDMTTLWCWGYGWGGEGAGGEAPNGPLDRKTRSMLNLAMLTALNRGPKLKLHVKGAVNNGVSAEEIKAILLHATVYCGIPAGLDAFKTANEALKELGKVPAGPAKK